MDMFGKDVLELSKFVEAEAHAKLHDRVVADADVCSQRADREKGDLIIVVDDVGRHLLLSRRERRTFQPDAVEQFIQRHS